jgi:hypothetical protein
MAFSLLDLNSGNFSLEFEETDTLLVATAIKELFGKAQENKGILANELKFCGAIFTYYFEYDPCIISNCQIGNICLMRLHKHLSQTT